MDNPSVFDAIFEAVIHPPQGAIAAVTAPLTKDFAYVKVSGPVHLEVRGGVNADVSNAVLLDRRVQWPT